MTAQEWLDWHDNFTFHPEYDPYFVTKIRTAADIIREQQERIEMLTDKFAEKVAEIEWLKKEVSHTKEVEFPRRVEKVTKTLAAKLQAAESLFAARLADQEAIERHVTKRVARECAEIAETFRTPHGSHPLLSGVQIGEAIRKKYGVE